MKGSSIPRDWMSFFLLELMLADKPMEEAIPIFCEVLKNISQYSKRSITTLFALFLKMQIGILEELYPRLSEIMGLDSQSTLNRILSRIIRNGRNSENENENENENDYREIINNLNNLIELCKDSLSSTYVIDRIKLKGKVIKKEKKNKVLILEPDEALSCLLKNVCELEGIKAEIASNKIEFEKIYEIFKPNVAIIDWGNKENENHLEIAKKISKDNIKIIFSSSYLNKKEILKAGADLYLPKPYEIDDIINWIKKFLN